MLNPLNLSVYTQSYNNPIRFKDPNGQIPLDTIWDAANVLYDVGKIGVGYATGNAAMMADGSKDLAMDALAMAVPYVPAGTGKLLRVGFKYSDEALDTVKAFDKADAARKSAEAAADAKKAADAAEAAKKATDAKKAAEAADQTQKATRGSALKPGPHAKESIPAHRGKPTAAEQRKINELMDKHGCHTCGTKNPGTKSGNAVGDHQPPQSLDEPKEFFPHCIDCSRKQGGEVLQELLKRQ